MIVNQSGTENVYYNEILGCLIHNNGFNSASGLDGHGLYSQSSFCIIDGNKVYDNAGYGIILYNSDTGGTASDSNNIVRNYLAYDNFQKNDGSTQAGAAQADRREPLREDTWSRSLPPTPSS